MSDKKCIIREDVNGTYIDCPFDVAALTAERDTLRFFVAQSLPFLEEAWKACFHGQETALLSAEERGMGRLLGLFREVADGKPALPPGVITTEEASRQTEAAIAWANRLLGQPNELAEPLQRYMMAGETCADGIRRAHEQLAAANQQADGLRGALEEARGVILEAARIICDQCSEMVAHEDADCEAIAEREAIARIDATLRVTRP